LQGNFAVQPQVFRGGRFGVWGTPPPKPLNCKVWENPAGALANPASRGGFMFPESKICRFAFRWSFSSNKKPCFLFGKQGFLKIYLLRFTRLPPVYPNWLSFPGLDTASIDSG
jgi:hypothetical protein